jgi:hypothetical protein
MINFATLYKTQILYRKIVAMDCKPHSGASMRNLITAFFLSLSVLGFFPAQVAPAINVSRNEVIMNFPETATFQLNLSNEVEITSIILEYGNEQQTCGEVIAKAFPQFTPGKIVETEWTWEMRQNGSQPPGTQLWWRWHVTDANGNETVTDLKTATWLDSVHSWQSIQSGQLNLHYYGLEASFAQEMLEAGIEGMNRNKNDAGLTTDDPVNIYVYPNYEDLREAILFESSWVGGSAYPRHNIVILGTSGFDSAWDKDTLIHELTHVVVGHFTFSCLGSVPQWLNEGLAVYSEGQLDRQFQRPLDKAIQENTVLSVRSISGSFSEVANRANLSYAQSYSLVNFLIETYGQDKMTTLLTAFRDGSTTDDALMQTYGFNIDGLEDQWRQAIGAEPRTVSAQPTVQPTPTFIPTIVPISGVTSPLQTKVTPIPTSSAEQITPENTGTRTSPPLSLTLILLAIGCALLLVIGVLVLGFLVRRQNTKGRDNVK